MEKLKKTSLSIKFLYFGSFLSNFPYINLIKMSSEKKVYKLNISGGNEGPGKGLSKIIEIDDKRFRFEGMGIGDIIKGGLVGFPNYEFEIRGGSDASGFPMRKDVHGPVKKRILVSKRGSGYKPKRKGQKKRRTVRGNEITHDMTLINLKVVKYGESELFKATQGE
jgi:small subunit ribosomal protein S6e